MRISKSGIMKLKTVSLLCVGSVLLCGILACSNQAKQSTEENNDEQQLFIGDNIAVAQTQYGKVKGFILKGIYIPDHISIKTKLKAKEYRSSRIPTH